MDNKVRLQFPKPENDAEKTAIKNCVFILEQNGYKVQTTNTVGEPCSPNKEYTPDDFKPWIPNEDEQNAIDEIRVIAETVNLDIIGTRPNDR